MAGWRWLGLAALLLVQAALADAMDDPVVLGRLRPAGGYVKAPSGHSVTVLEGGSVLLAGQAVLVEPGPPDTLPERLARLRDRASPDGTATRPSAVQLWDAAQHRWDAVEAPPDCKASLRSLHSATQLPGQRVLVGGGLCDLPAQPAATHAELALFDAATRSWSPAGRLTDARLLHSATALSDGAVIFVGGLVDPAVMRMGGWPVQRSVERWRDGNTQALPPLQQARAAHTATLLGDGSVLVVGGFDAAARPLALVERWLPQAQRWEAAAPLATGRHGHSATRLPDGRVLVAGGVDAEGQPLRSTELFDPASGRWSAGPLLPSGLRQHAATLLKDGAVLLAGGVWTTATRPVPWAWLWRPDLPGWRVAGHVAGDRRHAAAAPVHLHPLADGGALAFLDSEVLRLERLPDGPPALKPGEAEAPVWQQPPVLAALQGGQVLAVGRTPGMRGKGQIARIWERTTGRWLAAPDLPATDLLGAGAQQLPSGRVLLVAATADHQLVCWTWRRGERDWSACGGVPLLQSALSPMPLALLPDGRLLALPSTVQAVVFDEATHRWADWRVRRGQARMLAGAPVVPEGPFAEILDPDGGPAQRIDALMTRAEAMRLRGTGGLVGLWDARQQRWGVVMERSALGDPMGWLPDGCALSATPLAVFDPRTASVNFPVDAGIGNATADPWLLFDDGLVVSVDTRSVAADPGATWRVAQASCAGLQVLDAVQPYFSSSAPRPPQRSAGTVLPAAAAQPAASAAGPDRFNGKAKQLVGAAALALVLVGAGWFRAGRRGALQAALVLMVVGGLWWWSSGRAADARWRKQCDEEIAACLDTQTGLLHPAPGGSTSRIPCDFVGVWNWTNGLDSRRMEMRPDGRFVMAASAKDRNTYRGHWAVQRFGQDDKLVWRTAQAITDWDVNAIKLREPAHFELVERNGDITRFDRLDTPATEGCTP
ncbi:Kelch repeat-containing protein [Roseateles sp. LYH14W]|uniref:Kelch repeat-containing protein n=1 Tax=Pelomonas parva TaxID=3299032 RepID=A0ABW7F0B5_9BURK